MLLLVKENSGMGERNKMGLFEINYKKLKDVDILLDDEHLEVLKAWDNLTEEEKKKKKSTYSKKLKKIVLLYRL